MLSLSSLFSLLFSLLSFLSLSLSLSLFSSLFSSLYSLSFLFSLFSLSIFYSYFDLSLKNKKKLDAVLLDIPGVIELEEHFKLHRRNIFISVMLGLIYLTLVTAGMGAQVLTQVSDSSSYAQYKSKYVLYFYMYMRV